MAQKLASLIVDVAADISQIRGSLDQASAKISSFASGATKALGALGIAFGATEIASFALSVIDTAGDINDMSVKLGLSTDAVQKFGHAATLGGSNIETVAASINKLNINISKGGDGTIAALKQLGVSFDTLRTLSPEEQFLAITDALQKMENPQDRARLAMELMGKSAVDLLPAISDGFRGVADEADAMSEETVRRLAAAGDAWDDLKNKVVIITGELIAATAKMPSVVESAWNRATSSMKNASEFFHTALTQGVGVAVAMTGVTEQATKELEKHGEAQKAVAPKIEQTADELRKQEEAHQKAAAAAAKHRAEMTRLRDQLTGMDSVKAARDLLEAARGLDLTTLSAENTKQALQTLNEAIFALKSQGKAVPGDMLRMQAALQKVADTAYLSSTSLFKVKNGLTEMPGAIDDVTDSYIAQLDAWAKFERQLIAVQDEQAAAAKASAEQQQKAAADSAAAFDKSLKSIAGGFTHMSQVSGGAWSSVTQGIAEAITMVATAKDGFAALQDGFTALAGSGGGISVGGAGGAAGASGGGAAGAMTGILGVASSVAMVSTGILALIPIAIAAYQALDKVFGNHGRQQVRDYADTFRGGFDELHARLLQLGERGEAMWVKLTQEVKRNNRTAAQAAVQEAQEMLEHMDRKFNDSLEKQLKAALEFGGSVPAAIQPYLDQLMEMGRVTEENIDLMKQLSGGTEINWKKMEEAANKYGVEVSSLGDEFERLKMQDAWKELINDARLLVDGGADVNKMLEGMSDEISKLVQDSIKFGTDIPENMRPYIEQLAAAGLLLDENGNQIRDISGLSFGEAIKTDVEELVEAIRELVKSLSDVPDAIAHIPKSVDVDVNYNQRTSTGAMPPDYAGPHDTRRQPPGFSGGSHGLVNFGSGTLAMLHGREAVLTESQYKAVMSGGSTSIVVNVERGLSGPAADAELGDIISRKIETVFRQQGLAR